MTATIAPFEAICFFGKFFGKAVGVKHDAWQGMGGRGPRVCVYCKVRLEG